MKNLVLYAALSFCLTSGLMAQNATKKSIQPKENSKVTREYDEKGNLIRFDSVYSYSYSSDSTLMKHLSPDEMSKMFGGAFNFFTDSTISNNHSFFGDFDKMFADPFGESDAQQDSLWKQHFDKNLQFHQFNNNDSTTFSFGNFDNFFENFFENKNDSTSVKKQDNSASKSQPKSMEEMMQQRMKEMEKRQKKFFEESQNYKEN